MNLNDRFMRQISGPGLRDQVRGVIERVQEKNKKYNSYDTFKGKSKGMDGHVFQVHREQQKKDNLNSP